MLSELRSGGKLVFFYLLGFSAPYKSRTVIVFAGMQYIHLHGFHVLVHTHALPQVCIAVARSEMTVRKVKALGRISQKNTDKAAAAAAAARHRARRCILVV